MKIHKTVILYLLIFSIAFTSASSSIYRQTEFINLLAGINAFHLRQAKLTAKADIGKYEYPLPPKGIGFTKHELEQITDIKHNRMPSSTAYLTSAQASDDVNILFRVLKYCYAPYQYFGGDRTFGSAREHILCALSKSKTISTLNINDLLVQNLQFIKDGHFALGGADVCERTMYFYNESIEFGKDTGGFYKTVNNKHIYVKAVNSDTPSKYMRLSINPDGKLVYYVGENLWEARSKKILLIHPKVNITYKSGTSSDIMSLKVAWPKDYSPSVGYSYKFDGGIPVDKIPRLFDASQNDTTCEVFSHSGLSLKDKKIFVLDDRGNTGGDDSYFVQWLKNYTGKNSSQSFSTSCNSIRLGSSAGQLLSAKFLLSKPKPSTDAQNKISSYLHEYQYGYNYWSPSSTSSNIIDNKNYIFILMDKNVASSGESLILHMLNMQNTVLIGSNTGGVLLSNAEVGFVLPNSRIQVICGSELDLLNPGVFNECQGFSPDIWVGGDSLSRVIKMIHYYYI